MIPNLTHAQDYSSEMPFRGGLGGLELPSRVQSRLHDLLERQDKGMKLTLRERREAEGLVEMAEPAVRVKAPFSQAFLRR
ncbi:MAG: hypothetical protein ACO1TE_22930 [Prosthecobacter sp.]